jgi:ubiquinone/menaquinone biosynthesis C-methylase UbiE
VAVSRRVKGLYDGAYAHGVEPEWRDLGALDKAGNIVRVWRAAGLPDRPTVVEIGCGDGAIAAALQQQQFFGTYQGFELSQSGVEEARARKVPGATFTLTEGDQIPAEDHSADLVVLCHVVEHLEHPRTLLYEASRIARHVVVEVPLELNTRTPRDYVWDTLGHINKYSSTSIRHLIQTCDLEVVGQITTNPSLAVAAYNDSSRKRKLEWQLKERGLALVPAVARSLFTYHETILARRPN